MQNTALQPRLFDHACGLHREESDARVIINAADVKLRSFTTKVSIDWELGNPSSHSKLLQARSLGLSGCAAINAHGMCHEEYRMNMVCCKVSASQTLPVNVGDLARSHNAVSASLSNAHRT